MNNKVSKYIFYSSIILFLFIVQQTASKVGTLIANSFSYNKVDPHNLFANVSIHHVVQVMIALLIIIAFKNLYNITFGFKLGNMKEGLLYVGIFTIIMLIYVLLNYIIYYKFGNIKPINFPLNVKNVLGTLGFQLFLSGPSEEILFRALPISILLFVFKKRIVFKWGFTLETIIAAFLFSIAHIKWSLSPFVINMDYFQLVYAFILGIAFGKVYQKSNSILYPMLMHSISNVISVGIGYLFAVIV